MESLGGTECGKVDAFTVSATRQRADPRQHNSGAGNHYFPSWYDAAASCARRKGTAARGPGALRRWRLPTLAESMAVGHFIKRTPAPGSRYPRPWLGEADSPFDTRVCTIGDAALHTLTSTAHVKFTDFKAQTCSHRWGAPAFNDYGEQHPAHCVLRWDDEQVAADDTWISALRWYWVWWRTVAHDLAAAFVPAPAPQKGTGGGAFNPMGTLRVFRLLGV